MFSVTLIGPISRDIIVKNGSRHESIGGPVYYQSHLLSKLDIATNAVVTLAENDSGLLKKFPPDVNLIPNFAPETMKFQNIYPDNNPCNRLQKAEIPHNPIKIDKIEDKIKDSDAILLGPLSPYDIPLKTVEKLSWLDIPIYLGAQGYLRHLDSGKIVLKPWKDFQEFLKFINVLFIDINESSIILGKKHSARETAMKLASYGPHDVIITMGSNGSLIYSKKRDKIYRIPAKKPQKIVDPTGLGDTYMAAYVARKLETYDPQKCGLFASAAASLKLENKGAFKGDRSSVCHKIKQRSD